MPVKLNLGCGKKKIDGWINCDLSPEIMPDRVVDLEKKLPFEDNYADKVLLDNVFEHITNQVKLINEIWRVCKHGAIVEIIAPHCTSVGAWEDLTHKHPLTLRSFDYVSVGKVDKNSFYQNLSYEYGTAKFKILHREFTINKLPTLLGLKWLSKQHPFIYEQFISPIIPPSQIYFKLEVVK